MTAIRKRLSNWAFAYMTNKWHGDVSPGEYLAEFMGSNTQFPLTGDVYQRGELYVAGSIRGHYLDEDIATAFVDWLEKRGITV